MRKRIIIYCAIVLILATIIFQSCNKPDALLESEYNEWLSGGSQTVFQTGSGAFSSPFPNLGASELRLHEIGDLGFEATFVTAPAKLNSGLGPIYNNVSCASCHIADGRGKAPELNETLNSMLMRISIPGMDVNGGPLAVPGFGGQLQHRAIVGKQQEANVAITYSENSFAFSDGLNYHLRKPTYLISNSYLPLPIDVLVSGRVAPPVFGLGLLEAIDDESIKSNEDEFDSNNDGISGRTNLVWNVLQNEFTIGKFGWKAGQPTLLQQTAGAYNEDMGITSFIFPKESSFSQNQYDHLNDEAEISDSLLHAVNFYVKSLAVPAKRNFDKPDVIRGKNIFNKANCNSCHIPKMLTKVNVASPEFSNQLIFPYTDLLLHDMGEGLSDHRPEFKATGNEWRTPPLWGIGLTKQVNGHNNYLHDGRARSLMEAIMWHGGEAQQSADYVKNLPQQDRNDLIKFLEAL